MKKIGCLCLVLCAVLLFGGVCVPAAAAVDASVTSGCHSLDAAVPLLGSEQIVSNSQATVVYETTSDTLMHAWNADEKVHPASLVKIMTAMLAIRDGNMEELVTVTQDVLATVPYDAASAELQADEVLTLENLLYCMMVASANDAAAVIADHICGSQEAFVAEMNDLAAELGCTGTQFTNVHGLHDEQQYTTARDVARILAEAMKYELFQTVFGTVSYTVPATNKSETRELMTGNYLISGEIEIYYDSRVTGGRTGVANDGTRCIAASAEQNGLQLITVVIGAESVYKEDGYTVSRFGSFPETSELLNLGFAGYVNTQVLHENQALKQYSVLNGSSDVILGSSVSVSTILPEGVTPEQLSYRYSDASGGFTAPIQKGDQLSHLEIWHGNICVAQAELYAMNSVAVASAKPADIAEENSGSEVFSVILTVVLVLVGLAVILLIGLRIVNRLRMAVTRKRSRRYRRNRRRSR